MPPRWIQRTTRYSFSFICSSCSLPQQISLLGANHKYLNADCQPGSESTSRRGLHHRRRLSQLNGAKDTTKSIEQQPDKPLSLFSSFFTSLVGRKRPSEPGKADAVYRESTTPPPPPPPADATHEANAEVNKAPIAPNALATEVPQVALLSSAVERPPEASPRQTKSKRRRQKLRAAKTHAESKTKAAAAAASEQEIRLSSVSPSVIRAGSGSAVSGAEKSPKNEDRADGKAGVKASKEVEAQSPNAVEPKKWNNGKRANLTALEELSADPSNAGDPRKNAHHPAKSPHRSRRGAAQDEHTPPEVCTLDAAAIKVTRKWAALQLDDSSRRSPLPALHLKNQPPVPALSHGLDRVLFK